MSKIVSIGTAQPAYAMKQSDICSFMEKMLQLPEDTQRKLRILYERSGIETRHSVVPDYTSFASEKELFAPQFSDSTPSIEHRMLLYYKYATPLAVDAIRNAVSDKQLQQVTHLITVSCTGMSAPGLDIELMEQLGLANHVHRTSVNFMGCYAAVHALKMADAICNSNPAAQVLVVSVELCTLHFQYTTDYDTLTANALFADGAAACLVVADTANNFDSQLSLTIRGFYSEVQPAGKKDMAWHLSSTGFLMTLSSYIPQLVQANIKALTDRACHSVGLSRGDIKHWAIHPGGRKILEAVSEQLELPNESLHASYQVLQNNGNMSSATLLFVLKEYMQNHRPSEPIFAAAFGPGLTFETCILSYHV